MQYCRVETIRPAKYLPLDFSLVRLMLYAIHGIILPMNRISHSWIIHLSMNGYVIHGSVSYISWAKISPLPHGIHGRYISSMDIVCLDFHSAAVNAATEALMLCSHHLKLYTLLLQPPRQPHLRLYSMSSSNRGCNRDNKTTQDKTSDCSNILIMTIRI